MTASTEEATRNGSMPMSISRVKALGASLVCSVLNTKWPVSAARMAISAVSRSRISPTMITFGSWRRIWRRPMAKVRPISGPHRDLVDALEFVFDRLLDRDDALVDRVDRAQERVERGGFARAGRAGDQEDAVRLDDDLADGLLFQRREAELVQAQEDLAARQQAQRDALAIDRRHGGDADVDFLALDADVDAAVLRQALLGDVHPAT